MTQQQKIAEQIKAIGPTFENVCRNANAAADIAKETGVVGQLADEIDKMRDGLTTLAGCLEVISQTLEH